MIQSVGHLYGNGRSATCRVRKDDSGAAYIDDVAPALPEGDYDLEVLGLRVRVQFSREVWKQIEE